MIFSESDTRRFWGKVDRKSDDECWEWTGSKLRGGYGNLRVNKHTFQVHRYSYQLHYGEIPKGMLVCHTCDNPACVNPGHLFLGSHLDNARDKVAKGRQAKEECHSKAKLTRDDVIKIREMYSTGSYSMRKLCSLFGISYSDMNGIINKKYWRNV